MHTHTPARRYVVARGGLGDAVEGWLDIAKLVSGAGSDGGKTPFDDLAYKIGREVYVDINGWHLYLRDITAAPGVKMHTALARQLGTSLDRRSDAEREVEALLEQVPLVLGGGAAKVSLHQAIPKRCIQDFVRVVEDYQRDL